MKIAIRIAALALVSVFGVSAVTMHVSDSEAAALTTESVPTNVAQGYEPPDDLEDLVDNNEIVETPSDDVIIDEGDSSEIEATVGTLTDPTVNEPIQTPDVAPPEIPSTTPEIEAPTDEHHDANHSKPACDHFWRREYYPETDTEEGYLVDSCLYCGEWYVYQVIDPYDEA